jgi:hypothetical protein
MATSHGSSLPGGNHNRNLDRVNRKEDHTTTALTILRWISFLPLACVSGILGGMLIEFIGRVSITFAGFDSYSFVTNALITALSGIGMGAVIVWVGTYIAPSNIRKVSVILTGVILICSIIYAIHYFQMADYWSIYFISAINCGSIGTLIVLEKND